LRQWFGAARDPAREACRSALRRAGGEGTRVSPAGLPQRSVGVPRRRAVDWGSVLSRRLSLVQNRGGLLGGRRGRRGIDALPAARSGSCVQLRLSTVRSTRVAKAVRSLLLPVSGAVPARFPF